MKQQTFILVLTLILSTSYLYCQTSYPAYNSLTGLDMVCLDDVSQRNVEVIVGDMTVDKKVIWDDNYPRLINWKRLAEPYQIR
jgi:hypothetical protein